MRTAIDVWRLQREPTLTMTSAVTAGLIGCSDQLIAPKGQGSAATATESTAGKSAVETRSSTSASPGGGGGDLRPSRYSARQQRNG